MTNTLRATGTARRVAPPRPLVLAGPGLVVLLTVAHAAADIPYAALSALLPTIQARFDLTVGVLAVLVAVFSFAASLTQPLFGALADRVGHRIVGPVGLVASSALLSLVGVAPSFWLGMALLLAGGMASAALHPAFTSLARRAGGGRPGLAVSVFSAGGTLGVSIGPVAVLGLMATLGLGGTPMLMVPGVLAGVAAWFLLPDTEARDSSRRRPLFDLQLVLGPVGGLTAAAILTFLPYIALGAGVGIWLVAEHGIARDAPIIGWTLTAFAVGGAIGGIVAGGVAGRVGARVVIGGSMVAAALPLYALFVVPPGSTAWFVDIVLAGALLNAPVPVMVVRAQSLVPRSTAAAAGMLMGLAHGVAGTLYLGVGALQELLGIGPALAATFALVVPGAALATVVLTRVARSPTRPTVDCTCTVCRCSVPGTCACVV